jgi:hypothetical protein
MVFCTGFCMHMCPSSKGVLGCVEFSLVLFILVQSSSFACERAAPWSFYSIEGAYLYSIHSSRHARVLLLTVPKR